MMLTSQPTPTTTRVLVVEDEALIAEEISDRLTRLNYEVMGIEDTGAKALQAVREHGADLVLMDIRLKGPMDGIEAARQIRREFDVPVIYVTAHSDQATLERAKATAPLGYVLKPFQDRDLVMLDMALHRHRQEQESKRDELRHAAVLASIGEGVVTADLTGRVTFMNPAAVNLTARPLDDALGRPLAEVLAIVDEVSQASLEHPGTRALREGVTVVLDTPVLLLAADGSSIPIDDSAAPIREQDGRISGVVVALHDLRPRRLREAGQRRAQLQIHQTQKMDAVGSLAGGVAHDFNNLLTVISGSTEVLLERRRLASDDHALAEEIYAAAERATMLTRQLLTFSRRQIVQNKVIDLNRSVAGAHELLMQTLGEHIAMKLLLSPELDPIQMDPSQLEQVLLNLALNAKDAMPEGGELSIATSNISAELSGEPSRGSLTQRYVVLSVHDTGVGMPPEVVERAFDPFFTTKAYGSGSGLGLAMVHGIVTQAGGTIEVESDLGRGTTFTLTFPAVSGVTVQGPPPGRRALHGSETILLVDDEDGVRAVATLALSRHGYRVLSAQDGQAALAIWEARRGEIDMLVTDVVMPGISGRRLGELISADKPGVPILFISGYTDDTSVRRGVEGGRTSFLQKPFAAVTLVQKVREILDLAAVGRGRLLS